MRTIGLSLVLLLSACSGGGGADDFKPLPDSLLVPMFTDALILNAAFADTYTNIKDSLGHLYSEQLTTKYGITKVEFESNMDYIHHQPERLDSMLETVIKHIDDLEAEFVDAGASGL